MTRICLLFSLLCTAAFARPANHVFTKREISRVKKLVSPEIVRVWDPHEERILEYKALPLARVFDVVFGSSWRQEEEVLFTCVDGYQPSIAVADLLRNRSYLAFGIKGRKSFSVDNKLQAEKNVPLGPLYLVWDNVRKPALRVEGAVSWPYQVQEVAFIRFAEKFPKLAPKPDAPAQVREGFMKFRKHCFSCHAIDGEGGNKGPDLAGITQYKDNETLAKWILDPQSFKSETTMPALNKLLEDREKTVGQILAYLGTKTL